jgi:hypothetical protein
LTVFSESILRGFSEKKKENFCRKQNIILLYNTQAMPSKGINYSSATKVTPAPVLQVKGIKAAAKTTGTVVGAVTKAVFSNNMALYTKGSNSFGGGARSVSNSGAVSRRT